MHHKVLITAPYLQPALGRYRDLFVGQDIELIVPPVTERFKEDALLRLVPPVHGVICGDDQFTKRVLRAATNLRVISKWGTGIDSIDQAACRRLGIALRNTPGAFTEPVADSVLGYVLCFARRIPWMNDDLTAGRWQKLECRALAECSLGVIGVGNIGKAVIRRARAFGMRIWANDIVQIDPHFAAEQGLSVVGKAELLASADFVSLNCDLNESSHMLMATKALATMRHTAVLINTARGAIIDEQALVRALHKGAIAGAALDVFAHEPLPQESPLRSMRNVMLAPHNANSSTQAWHDVNVASIANLLEVLGRPVTCSL